MGEYGDGWASAQGLEKKGREEITGSMLYSSHVNASGLLAIRYK